MLWRLFSLMGLRIARPEPFFQRDLFAKSAYLSISLRAARVEEILLHFFLEHRTNPIIFVQVFLVALERTLDNTSKPHAALLDLSSAHASSLSEGLLGDLALPKSEQERKQQDVNARAHREVICMNSRLPIEFGDLLTPLPHPS